MILGLQYTVNIVWCSSWCIPLNTVWWIVQKLHLKHEQLSLIPPQFEVPLPPLQPAVFPPYMKDPTPPALELFDLVTVISTVVATLCLYAFAFRTRALCLFSIAVVTLCIL